ncbi:MAG: type III polyketide synthase [Deltaproteobacteria bacterium]|nr:type III polyketide synthase [Deltaproteobacteria bacterium]
MSTAVVDDTHEARWRARLEDSARAPYAAAVEVAFPDHAYSQRELMAVLQSRWAKRPEVVHRIARLHESVQVGSRCIALPLDAYGTLSSFDEANDAFIRVGTEVGGRAVQRASAGAGLSVRDIDAIFFTTVTGVAAPSIDARLVNAIGLRRDIRRVPMFGLGCLGGAAGLARTADYLRGHPDHVAVLLSVELCSLTLQEDLSVANLIATGLFGDGAACAVLVGSERRKRMDELLAARAPANDAPPSTRRPSRVSGPRVLDARSVLWPDTERVMGWDVGASGFKVVLSADVPKIVRTHLAPAVDAFLADHGLTRSDISRWVCHPGGPKVIDAMETSLELPEGALAETRKSLASVGNLSSASVLHVLSQTMKQARSGELGLLMAMGPGFCGELVLLSW